MGLSDPNQEWGTGTPWLSVEEAPLTRQGLKSPQRPATDSFKTLGATTTGGPHESTELYFLPAAASDHRHACQEMSLQGGWER